MKNWLTRLFGGADPAPVVSPVAAPVSPSSAGGAPGAAAAVPAGPSTQAPPPDHATLARRLDLAFCRWLTDPVRGDAAAAAEQRILAEIARLAGNPAAAGDLVPRVPAVVPQLLKSLRDDSVSSADLARQIARDAVLVAETIREANSPLFRRGAPVRSIDAAVMVLGESGLRILLARVAFRPIINMQGGPGGVARLVAPRLWAQSDKCALAASLLAADLGADPFEAYLAGLMLNLGLIVALRIIDRLEQPLVPQSDAFCVDLLAGARELSAAIAAHWELPPFVAGAIVRAVRPGTIPLAEALGRADLLAKLRLLVDHGVYAADEPSLQPLLAGAAGDCFARLGDAGA